jgi:ferric-dicitrate binding protein FerR (iron transport regulator)
MSPSDIPSPGPAEDERFIDDVVRYLEGGADAAQIATLEKALRQDQWRRERFVAIAHLRGLLQDTLLERRASATRPRRPSGPRKLASWTWAVAAAALVLLSMGAWIQLSRPGPAEIESATGTCSMLRRGHEVLLVAGMQLRERDVLRCGGNGELRLRYADGTIVTADRDSEVILARSESARTTITLSSGTLTASVVPQPQGHQFAVATNTALVTVMGTRFTVLADRAGTTLRVDHGRVALSTTDGAAGIEVTDGQSAELLPASSPQPRLLPDPRAKAPKEARHDDSAELVAHPFADDSPWNRPIASDAEYSPVETRAWDVAAGLTVLTRQSGRKVVVATVEDGQRDIFARRTSQLLASARVEFDPTLTRLLEREDSVLLIIDPERLTVTECHRPEFRQDKSISAAAVSIVDLRGPGVPPDGSGSEPSRLPALGGLIRKGEARAGIPHALALTVRPAALNRHGRDRQAWVWPAAGPIEPGSALGERGNLSFGTRLALPRTFDPASAHLQPGTPAFAIATALQRHGAFITGTGQRMAALLAEVDADSEIDDATEAAIAPLLGLLQVVENSEAP